MAIGKMRYRVAIIREMFLDDGYGGGLPRRDIVAHVWAAVDEVSMSESWRYNRTVNETIYNIRMRKTDIKPNDKIEHEKKLLEIMQIIDKRLYYHIIAKAVYDYRNT